MKLIFRIFEEVLPIFPFCKNKNSILKKVSDKDVLSRKYEEYEKYEELGSDCLNVRIKEEHERAIKIDEKTFKFTLCLSVVLTVLTAVSGSFIESLLNSSYAVCILIIFGIAFSCMFAAGLTALGAMKTLATYGYGTDHLLNQKKIGDSYLAKALYAQEQMNIIRQMRNEAAYQFLRNGFLMLFLALGLSVVILGNSSSASKPTKNNIEEVSKKREAKGLDKKVLVSDEKVDNKSM